MHRVGQVPDHVQRSYKEHNRWMCVPEVRKVPTFRDFAYGLLLVLSICAFIFAVCVMIAMYVQMK